MGQCSSPVLAPAPAPAPAPPAPNLTCAGDENGMVAGQVWSADGIADCTWYAAGMLACMLDSSGDGMMAYEVCHQCGQCSSPVLAPAPAPNLTCAGDENGMVAGQVWSADGIADCTWYAAGMPACMLDSSGDGMMAYEVCHQCGQCSVSVELLAPAPAPMLL